MASLPRRGQMGHYNSFVVRVWSGGPGRLRGTIEHVATRSRLAFVDPSAVVDFIRSHLEPPTVDAEESPLVDPRSITDPGDDEVARQ
jgi:hypothetical protein